MNINDGEVGNQNRSPSDNINFDPCVVRPPNARDILKRKFRAAIIGASFKDVFDSMIRKNFGLDGDKTVILNELRRLEILSMEILEKIENQVMQYISKNDSVMSEKYRIAVESGAYDGSAILLDVLYDQDVRGFLNGVLEAAGHPQKPDDLNRY